MKSSICQRNAKPAVWSMLRTSVIGTLLTVLMGVHWCQQAEAKPPVAGTYGRVFDTPTNLYGMNMVGWVAFYSTNLNVEFAQLAEDTVMCGQTPLPAGTGIHFTPDGKPDWCFLPKNHEIQGHLFRGGGHEWMTCFYPSGRLKSGGLVHIEIIDGIPCDVGSFWNEAFGGGGRTFFYENGKLQSAKVARTITYRDQTIKKGKHVHLKPDGSIKFIK